MSNPRTGLFIAVLSIISACGDDAHIVPFQVNADAGGARFVALASTVSLDCRASSPASGTCAWRFVATPAGSGAVLQDPATQTPRFVADVEGLYQIELTYTVQGIAATNQVGIIALKRPEVSVSPDLAVSVGQTAVVEATAIGSGEDALTYAWSLTIKPGGSAARLTGADRPSASFVADVAGTYVVAVEVSDRTVAADPVPVTVTATH